jgi:hypothetical protein
MEQGLGMLFASGWTLDDVLGLTWGQLHVVSRCVVAYKAEQANLVMGAISSALGGKMKKPPRPRPEQQEGGESKPAGQKRDAASRLASLGLPIEDV